MGSRMNVWGNSWGSSWTGWAEISGILLTPPLSINLESGETGARLNRGEADITLDAAETFIRLEKNGN